MAREIKISIPIHIAETLQGFLDGGIGSSFDDEFSKQMKVVLDKLDKQINKIKQQSANH